MVPGIGRVQEILTVVIKYQTRVTQTIQSQRLSSPEVKTVDLNG